MRINKKISSGFSKKSRLEKITTLEQETGLKLRDELNEFTLKEQWQKKFEQFSENTLSNFVLPYGVCPNLLMNQKIYHVPMAIEESSVVAASAKASKVWGLWGGVHSEVLGTIKEGTIHLKFKSDRHHELEDFIKQEEQSLLQVCDEIGVNMKKRGGGVLRLQLINKTHALKHHFVLQVQFETVDAMGANFINSCLEAMSSHLLSVQPFGLDFEVVMSILSNYTPYSLARSRVEAPIEELDRFYDRATQGEVRNFSEKFVYALEIATTDVSRAVTHNKGIMNGVDAVVLATGNDFRACEAACHAYAARSGQYRSLSSAHLRGDKLVFELTLPLSLGVVGGLTKLHPLAKASLEILGSPSARELMMLCSSIGLMQNFGAVSSLVTTGIQKGHMKMHLMNILYQLNATQEQIEAAKEYFKDKVVSVKKCQDYLNQSN